MARSVTITVAARQDRQRIRINRMLQTRKMASQREVLLRRHLATQQVVQAQM